MKRHLQKTLQQSLTACFLFCFIVSATAGTVYKWVDTQGKIHYSDRPQDTVAQTLDIPPPPPIDEALQQRREALKQQKQDAESKKQQQQASKATATEPSQEEREKNCSIAQENLKKLESATGLLFETDKEGNRRLLAADERSKAAATMRTETERWCR